ncbi:class I SAM-dependent methyltransferase [Candidatus Pacearchaeota archaeon]|nr:class I SAM-dependent methyltransferase [Candidatus Pacearchaeota archaeon]
MAKRKQDIPSFMKSYWPLSKEAKAIQDLIARQEEFGEEELERLFKKRYEGHEQFLQQKYGSEVIDAWERCAEEHIAGRSSREEQAEGYHILNSFVYKTGLCLDAPLPTIFRTRATLESLLVHLSQREETFSLIDLGCGECRITTGLALYLDNLERIDAVDINPDALACAQKIISTLRRSERETIGKKVTFRKANFISEEFRGEMDKRERFDLALAAYPHEHPANIITAAKSTLKPSGALLAFYDGGMDYDLELVDFYTNYVHKFGFEFSTSISRAHWFNAHIFGIVGKKVKDA